MIRIMAEIVRIQFRVISVNVSGGETELIFPHNGKFYRLSEDKAPSEWFKLRKIFLWLTQGETYSESVTVDLSVPAEISIDLSVCEEIPESYPL